MRNSWCVLSSHFERLIFTLSWQVPSWETSPKLWQCKYPNGYLTKVNFRQIFLDVWEVAEEFAIDRYFEQAVCGHHSQIENLAQIEGKCTVAFCKKMMQKLIIWQLKQHSHYALLFFISVGWDFLSTMLSTLSASDLSRIMCKFACTCGIFLVWDSDWDSYSGKAKGLLA